MSKELVIALCALIGVIVSNVLTYMASTRNATRQVTLQRETDIRAAEEKRDALLASVRDTAASSGRELYQQLCTEQQERITQQHGDLLEFADQQMRMRVDLENVSRDLRTEKDELRKARIELEDVRRTLSARIVELERELAKYRK